MFLFRELFKSLKRVNGGTKYFCGVLKQLKDSYKVVSELAVRSI